MVRLYLCALGLLVLSACATPTAYGPAPEPDGYGFTDTKLEENLYRVRFRGNPATPRESVERYLIRRAAELTLAQGYDYFIIREQRTIEEERYAPATSREPLTGRYVHRDEAGRSSEFPYYNKDDAGTPASRCFCAMAYISLHKGDVPAQTSHAFDAQTIVRSTVQE